MTTSERTLKDRVRDWLINHDRVHYGDKGLRLQMEEAAALLRQFLPLLSADAAIGSPSDDCDVCGRTPCMCGKCPETKDYCRKDCAPFDCKLQSGSPSMEEAKELLMETVGNQLVSAQLGGSVNVGIIERDVDHLLSVVSAQQGERIVRHDCEEWAMEGMGCAHCNPAAAEHGNLVKKLAAAEARIAQLEQALRMTRTRDEHRQNCRIDGCLVCANLQTRTVTMRCDALGDEKNPAPPLP